MSFYEKLIKTHMEDKVKLPERLKKFFSGEHEQHEGKNVSNLHNYSSDSKNPIFFSNEKLEVLFYEHMDNDLANEDDRFDFVPLASLDDAQYMAVKITEEACPVYMWEHEDGEFHKHSSSLDEFLKNLHGNSFTVTYGKSGTAGSSQTKTFDSEEKSLKEAEKLVEEKMKKGYAESNDLSEKKSVWEELLISDDLHSALIKHFTYLADSPGHDDLLKSIMKKARKATIEQDLLVIEFDKGYLVGSRGETNLNKKNPTSFSNLVNQHSFLSFSTVKDLHHAAIGLGNVSLGKCYFDFDIYDDGDEVYALFNGKEDSVLCALHDLDTADWIYHPTIKNSQGEPALFPVIHEEEDEINLVEENAGSLFIKALARELDIE